MMRIGQVLLRGVAAMAGLANDTAVKPRCDQQRAGVAQRLALALARCWHRGQTGWGDRQCPWPAAIKQQPRDASGGPVHQRQPLDPAELTDVVAHDSGADGQSVTGDP